MDNAEIIRTAIKGSEAITAKGRERTIIENRFGLNNQKQTLEEIGDRLGITRERVRQLEKAVLIRLRIAAEDGKIKALAPAEKLIIRHLIEMGRVARVNELATKIYKHKPSPTEKAAFLFLAEISPLLTFVSENYHYYSAIGIAEYGDEKALRTRVAEIEQCLKSAKKPLNIEELDAKLDYEHPMLITAIAKISKQLAFLNGYWGLSRWSSVNPKNIRDKIAVILGQHKKPMHFTQIAQAIKESEFKRRDVTLQAVHNELIKDPRFILVGRGTYALAKWGYEKGTVAEVITRILVKAGDNGLSRKEIVKHVLKVRKVKETTILLNLQNKKLFRRIEDDIYILA